MLKWSFASLFCSFGSFDLIFFMSNILSLQCTNGITFPSCAGGWQSFPTLLMFSHGKVYKYEGGRKLEFLMDYAKVETVYYVVES